MKSFVTYMYMYLAFLVLCLSPGSAINASGQELKTDIKVLVNGGRDGRCPSKEERESVRKELRQITISTVLASTGHIHACNGTPGWRRVAFINMTDPSYNCPSGLNLTSYSKRTCGRSHTSWEICPSTTFSVGGLPYSRVCGRIRAYQFGPANAFYAYTEGIDSYYVDGVSLTHGAAGRRQHIWTFAAGVINNDNDLLKCPCDTSRNYYSVPSFVGNDYFCEIGSHSPLNFTFELFPSDILWDGQNCTSTSTCCQFNNPPWFTKNLTNATTDDIELRICTSQIPEVDLPTELIELYVQ